MKFLKETLDHLEYFTEKVEENGKQHLYLNGIFLQAEIKNQNGRIYPMNVMEEEVARYTEKMIERKRAFGELNHPTTPSINLDKVSHIITELKRDGNNFIGKAKILENTPMGRIAATLMEEGSSLGVSSRSLGALKERNGAKYVEQLHITTAADIVHDPSGPDCFPDIVLENVEYFLNGENWEVQEKAVALNEEFKKKSRAEREEKFLEHFEKLFRK